MTYRNMELSGEIAKLLQFPKNTFSAKISLECGQPIRVECTYWPETEEDSMLTIQGLAKKYTLTATEVEK